jgi:hypothetical protein
MSAGKCPICARPAVPGHRPFCSERCANLDLAQWLGGKYRIPTDEAPTVYEGERESTEDVDR